MERLQEVKMLLKRWEAEFLRERQRKPSQADIEEAPEETRRLYKEYRMLKQQGKASDPSGKAESQEIPPAEQVEDSGFWGSHLNRKPKIPRKTQSGSAGPGISAQFYGMKLKSKLGMAGKEPPLTPRRTPNPRRIPRIPQSQKNSGHGAKSTFPEPPRNEGESGKPGDSGDSGDLVLPPSVSGLGSLLFPAGTKPSLPNDPEKFQRLKQTVAQTLGSLDPAWLQRCQESPGNGELPSGSAWEKGEIHAAGAASTGNSTRKRPWEGGGDAEAPAKLRRSLRGSEPGILGMKRSREEKEDEEEQLEFPKEPGKALDRLENLLEEEEKVEKPRPTRRARATPRSTGNFVMLNLKRKTYSRGFSRGKFLRKQVWKQKWRKKLEHSGSDRCFRCGGKGHWASECRGKDSGSFPGENDPKDEEEEEEEPLPTLEEVARRTNSVFIPEIPASGANPETSHLTPNSLDFQRLEYSPPPPPAPVDPLYLPGPDGTIPDPPEEVLEALRTLGYDSFRPGQAMAVMRILSGLSTLVVLSTGMGKSLCYQLPAFLYHKNSGSISLVISPLVSLMDDQVSGLPPCLQAVCIHSNLSQSQREAALEKVREGRAQVLLLSPEAAVGSGSHSLFSLDRLPPVAFACLDEAHCVSQWSHNFRPSYLRICKVLRERLGVRCFLGLTATATPATARDVAQHLGIPPENGIAARSAGIPGNLRLSVSMDPDRDQALISLLRGERFGSLDSIIVYCTRREETSRIAALIRTQFQGIPLPESREDAGKKKGKGKTPGPRWIAEAYHAGLSAWERRRIQRDFMSGRLRVLVATVAFGMGLDKSDIRGIIHYNMPRNFESYVQEIGRAGRDGIPARCHLFLEPEGADLPELRRHIYGDSVDFLAVKKLVQRVFAPCKCPELRGKFRDGAEGGEAEDAEIMEFLEEEEAQNRENLGTRSGRRICRKHERSLPIQETVESLDMREEGIETLLCYLELHPKRWLELLPPAYSRCRIRCSGGSRQLRAAARSCPAVAAVLALDPGGIGSGSAEFDIISLSDSMGWESAPVKRSLRRLQWDGSLRNSGAAAGGTSGIRVEFQELSFRFRAYGDLSGPELDSVCEFLHGRVVSREKAALGQLRACFRAFRSVAFQSCHPHPPEEEEEERSSRLKELLREYFERDEAGSEEKEEEVEEKNLGAAQLRDWESQIRADIRHFLAIRPDETFSGRAIARIFHGIGSPCFPAQIYGRDRRFWRRHLRVDFHGLSRLATEEILAGR